jgi:predicted phosphoribosyltransferase
MDRPDRWSRRCPAVGYPVALQVARAVHGELDVVIARKIGLPWQPELGVGAVAENGPPVLDRELLNLVGLTDNQM